MRDRRNENKPTKAEYAPDEQERCHDHQPPELHLQPLGQRHNNVRSTVLPSRERPVLQISSDKLDAEDGVDDDRDYMCVK